MNNHPTPAGRPRVLSYLAIVALAVAVAACGSDDPKEPGAAAAPTSPTAVAAASSESLPDACAVLSAGDIQAAFGSDPGTTETITGSARNVCFYKSGFIVAVARSAYFETSLQTARANSQCTDTTGIGDKALFCVNGTSVGQLFWLDGDLMYDLTGLGTELAPFRALAAKATR